MAEKNNAAGSATAVEVAGRGCIGDKDPDVEGLEVVVYSAMRVQASPLNSSQPKQNLNPTSPMVVEVVSEVGKKVRQRSTAFQSRV